MRSSPEIVDSFWLRNNEMWTFDLQSVKNVKISFDNSADPPLYPLSLCQKFAGLNFTGGWLFNERTILRGFFGERAILGPVVTFTFRKGNFSR